MVYIELNLADGDLLYVESKSIYAIRPQTIGCAIFYGGHAEHVMESVYRVIELTGATIAIVETQVE